MTNDLHKIRQQRRQNLAMTAYYKGIHSRSLHIGFHGKLAEMTREREAAVKVGDLWVCTWRGKWQFIWIYPVLSRPCDTSHSQHHPKQAPLRHTFFLCSHLFPTSLNTSLFSSDDLTSDYFCPHFWPCPSPFEPEPGIIFKLFLLSYYASDSSSFGTLHGVNAPPVLTQHLGPEASA